VEAQRLAELSLQRRRVPEVHFAVRCLLLIEGVYQ
jgi:hypothetical protein